jgi:hypothetical protein
MHGQQYTRQLRMTKNDKKSLPYVAKRVKADSPLFQGAQIKREVRLEIDPGLGV